MAQETKKCPMCAEIIPLVAARCEYCRAKFEVTITGYCTNCHTVRRADANCRCTHCGTTLVDVHTESEYIQPQIQAVAPPPPTFHSAARIPVQPAKKKTAWLSILGIGLVLTGLWFLATRMAILNLPSILATPTPWPTTTQTSTPTRTPRPTRTPLPTLTPLPVEIDFDTIGDHPVNTRITMTGYLVLFSSTRCSYTCGLLLAELPGSSSKVTVFVYVAKEGVEPNPNQLKALPDNYGKWDIRVRLDDGEYAFIGQRIAITGRICETTDGDVCISDITKIELAR